jgi:site-specific recombinase XerD
MSERPLSHYLEAYLLHLGFERALSPKTLDAYGCDLGGYLAHLAARGIASPGRAGPEDVAAYVERVRAERRASPASVARLCSSLRGFHRFLLDAGYAEGDPTTLLEAPRPWRRLPRVLSVAEVERLIASVEPSGPFCGGTRSMVRKESCACEERGRRSGSYPSGKRRWLRWGIIGRVGGQSSWGAAASRRSS